MLLGGALLAAVLPTAPSEAAPVAVGPSRRRMLIAIVAVTAVAAATRLYRFSEVPPGLWADETAIARVALEGLNGHGQPPWQVMPHLEIAWAYVWVEALLLKLLPPGILAVRLPGTLAGILVAPALYLLARRFLRHGVAVLVGALWGVAFWALNMGRWGHANSFTPLFFCLAMGWVWDGLSTARRLPWILAGAAFGTSLYVYQANRALVPLIFVFVAHWVFVVDRSAARRAATGLAFFGLVALPLVAPLVACYLSNPGLYLERTRAVSIFDRRYTPDAWQGILGNLGKFGRAFHYQGDLILRHNMLGRPMLDPVLAALFTLGLGRVMRLLRRPGAFLAFAWVGLFLAAGVLTTEAPNTFRVFGMVPGILLTIGVGLDGLATALTARRERTETLGALGLAIFISVAALDLPAYFGRFAVLPGTWAGFNAGETRVGLTLARLAGPWTIYTDFLHNSTNTVLARRPQEELHVTDHLLAPSGSPLPTLWVLEPYDWPMAAFLKIAYPRAEVAVDKSPQGQMIYGTVAVPAAQNPPGLLVERRREEQDGGVPTDPGRSSAVAPLGAESAIPAGHLRVSWHGALRTPATGKYRFEIVSTNATALFFNGERVADLAGMGRVVADVWLPQGAVPMRIERAVRRADTLALSWSPPGEEDLRPLPPEATAAVPIPEGGLLALTWAGARFTGPPAAVRHDPLLLAVRYGSFAVSAERWIGDLVVSKAGIYRITLNSDDGSRLYLDGTELLSRWELNAGLATASRALTEGRHSIVIEFVDYGGSRWFELRWTPPGGAEERLPTEVLRWRPEHLAEALAQRHEPDVAIEGVDASGWRVGSIPLKIARSAGGESARQNANALGWILKAGLRMFDSGIGIRGSTSLDFALEREWSRLTGKFAVDRDTYGNGSVVFRIVGDGRTLFESGSPPLGEPAGSFEVSVAGVKLLTLAVDKANDPKGDLCDWLDLKLIK